MNIMHAIIGLVLFVVGYVSYPIVFEKDSGFLANLIYTKPLVEPVREEVDDNKDKKTLVFRVEKTNDKQLTIEVSDYPKTCKMLKKGIIILEGGSGKLNLTKGQELTPVKVAGNNLSVNFDFNGNIMSGIVATRSTNFIQLVEKKQENAEKTENNTVKRIEKKPVDTSNSFTLFSEDELSGGAESNEKDKPNVVRPTKEQSTGDSPLSELEVRGVLEDSFTNIDSLAGVNVTDVTLHGTEQLDGQSYQVGEVTFEKDTILGSKKLKVKGYVLADRVEKWVWSRSNLEIK